MKPDVLRWLSRKVACVIVGWRRSEDLVPLVAVDVPMLNGGDAADGGRRNAGRQRKGLTKIGSSLLTVDGACWGIQISTRQDKGDAAPRGL